jgi:hypothetical protein
MRKMATLAFSAVVATIVVAIAAWGMLDTGAGAAQDEPELGELPHIESYDDVVFPLDAYHLPPEQRIALVRANDILVRDCMRRYGFDFELPVRTVEPELEENRVIGLVDADEAAQFGYKPAWFAEYSHRVNKTKSKQTRWPPEMMAVLYGNGPSKVNDVAVPEGGCNAEARRHLDENTVVGREDENFVVRLEGISGELAQKDSRLEAAFASWSDCMLEAGYDYHDPWQANNDPAFAEERVSAHEIAVATTDVACRDKHNVNGIWVAVRSAYQNRLIEANAKALRQHDPAKVEQDQPPVDAIAAHRQPRGSATSRTATIPGGTSKSFLQTKVGS